VAVVIVLDACVLIAFVDPSDASHDAAVSIMETLEPLAIAALTGAELMVRAVDRSAWVDIFRELAIEVIPITAEDMVAIAATRCDSGLRMPDAIVLWLARTTGSGVASFDRRLLAKAEQLGVRVVR
jgi:predicted nucleic acid-binding protein